MREKNYKRNWKKRVYQLLGLVLVSIPVSASLEIWDQNHDLIIPSSEMQSISVLDSKAKQEIIQGWTCCYHPTLIEQVYQQQSVKSIEFRLRENRKKLQYTPQFQVPTEAQVRLFWALSVIDVALTYHAIKDPEIREANPLLGTDPTLFRLVLHKGVLGPIIVNNASIEQLKLTNTMLGIAVANNMRIMFEEDAW